MESLAWLELRTRRSFGCAPNPLLVSVRSGAAVSFTPESLFSMASSVPKAYEQLLIAARVLERRQAKCRTSNTE